MSRRPEGTNIGTHAGTGDDIDRDVIFLQHLDDADMGETPGTAGGESQTDPRTGEGPWG